MLEADGPGLQSMPIGVRMGVANGSNHIGAMTTVFAADQRLLDYLRPRTSGSFEPVTQSAMPSTSPRTNKTCLRSSHWFLDLGTFQRSSPSVR